LKFQELAMVSVDFGFDFLSADRKSSFINRSIQLKAISPIANSNLKNAAQLNSGAYFSLVRNINDMTQQGTTTNGTISDTVMIKDLNNLRNDNIFVSSEVRNFKDLTGINARKGLDMVIISNGEIVNVVSKSYGHLPNETFFGQVENMLLEADIQTSTRSINRDNRSFAVDHILNDQSLVLTVKNGMDELRPMLRFTNSYDGSARTSGHFGFYRKVCDNGLHIAHSSIGFNIKHKGDIAEVVMPNIKHLIARFMNNEFYELHRKFEVLAETPLKNIEDYVKLTASELKLFMYQSSKDNTDPSLNARTVINIINRESRMLGTEPNMWHLYNAFNEVLHGKLKRSFQNQRETDSRLFDFTYQLAQ